MQISHVVCQGANIEKMLFLRKSAGLNSELSPPKSHLRYSDFIIKVSFLKIVTRWLDLFTMQAVFFLLKRQNCVKRKTKNIFLPQY